MKTVLPLLLVALAGCQSTGQSDASAQPDLLQANLDTTVRPGDDFFRYANGAWLQKHPIPASESSWSIGKEVQNEVYARLRKINEDAAQDKGAASGNQQKIGDFWATGMDSVAADRQGLAPLRPGAGPHRRRAVGAGAAGRNCPPADAGRHDAVGLLRGAG